MKNHPLTKSLLSLLLLVIVTSCVSSNIIFDRDNRRHHKPVKKLATPFYLKPIVYIIKHHKKVATHMDGPRCPLYPTCSHFSHVAISKHGIWGLFLFIDRLFYREFASLHEHYIPVPLKYSKRLRFYDPIEDTFPILSQNEPSLLHDEF